MKSLFNGLITGLILQVAIGPVFFFIINLVLQRSFFDGLAGVFAVTLVDYFYITLAIFGIGKLLENKRVKKTFGIVSSIALAIFGLIIFMGAREVPASVAIASTNILSSFVLVFLLTISSPMTIIFFTSLFTTKAVEYNYTKRELLKFGLGTGFATFLFMGISVIVFSIIKGSIPLIVIQSMNLAVGCLLVVYGIFRLFKILSVKKLTAQ